MEKNIYDLFKKIGLSASIAMALSMLINIITKTFVIKIVALAIIFVAVCAFLFIKKKGLLFSVGLSFLVGIIAAMLLPTSYSLIIMISLAAYVLMDKLPLLLKISLFVGLSLLIKGITDNLVIRIGVLSVGFVLLSIIMAKEKEDKYIYKLAIILVSIVLSFLLSTNLPIVIIAFLVSLVLVKKVPDNFKPVAFIILFTVFLTWILPISYFSGELVSEGKSQLGLFDLFSYPNIVISYFGNNFIYLLVIGGFYGVLFKTGVFGSVLKNISKKAKGKEKVILSVFIVVIAGLVAVCGASLGALMIIPFIIALILMMGYDKITAAMVSVGSISLGLMGNLFSSTFIASDYNMTAQNGAGVINNMLKTNPMSMLLPKAIILVLGTVLLIVSVCIHAKKAKSSSSEDILEYVPEIKENDKKSHAKIWPLVLVFDLTFVIIMLALTSWTSVFKVNIFTSVTEFVLTKVNISGFPIIGKLLGSVKPFEQWGLVEISTLMVISSFIIALIYKLKFTEFIDSFVKGAKKAFKPAVLVTLIFTVLVIVSYNPITLTILKPILGITKNFNVFTNSLSAFIASIFNVDIYYIASNCLQYTSSVFPSAPSSLVALIWYSMYGFATLVGPTSVVLIAVLSYLNIPYKKWLKSNWLFTLGILLIMMIVFTICMVSVK